MGLRLAPSPNSLQNLQPIVCNSNYFLHKSRCAIYSSPLTVNSRINPALAYHLVHRSVFSGLWDSKRQQLMGVFSSANHDEFPDQGFSLPPDDDAFAVMGISAKSLTKGEDNTSRGNLAPHVFGIKSDPPDWPEKNEIERVSIEMKANRVELPLSLKMIKRKQKLKETQKDKGEFAYCSVKKAFSSMVFIIKELHTFALHIREILCYEDLKRVMGKVQREIDASFVWLFQQVFSPTPTLMVYVMILLANFTVHSLLDHSAIAAASLPSVNSSTVLQAESITGQKNQRDFNFGFDSPIVRKFPISSSSVANNEGNGGANHLGKSLLSLLGVGPAVDNLSGMSLSIEEVSVWKSVVDEATRMQAEMRDEALDHDTMQKLVSPVTVQLEDDAYEEFFRTDLLYQMSLAEEPNNPLLLSNYAKFLHLVARDYDRAEECFKRAVMVEERMDGDGEASSRYADFLWMVRKDLWGAEVRYQQAMEAEPQNSYYASKYASFLWNTGGEDTCFSIATYEKHNHVS